MDSVVHRTTGEKIFPDSSDLVSDECICYGWGEWDGIIRIRCCSFLLGNIEGLPISLKPRGAVVMEHSRSKLWGFPCNSRLLS